MRGKQKGNAQDFISQWQAYSEQEIQVLPAGVDALLNNSFKFVLLPLSYRRLVAAKAIKLG